MTNEKTVYSVKTIFPASESGTDTKKTTTKQTMEFSKQSPQQVTDLYNGYLKSDYKVSATYSKPKDDDNVSVDPFAIGKELTKQGIDYKATLKIKTKASYSDMKQAWKLVAAEGFDTNATVTLKVNDESSVDLDNPDTWQDSDNAQYKITPKASSNDVEQLHSLYDELDGAGYETEIDIKPKMPKDAANVTDSFMAQLSAYPSGTLVTFRLSENKE